jgi:predicted nucleic acid-binding protein
MILLDTNVVSEVMRQKPSENVLHWLNQQNSVSMFISSITIAEICYGLRVLPTGQRRRQLETRFEAFVAQGFSGRILDFDEAAARAYAEFMGICKEKGCPMSLPDGQIAAVAHVNRLALATRNIRDFVACGIELINPFDQTAAFP